MNAENENEIAKLANEHGIGKEALQNFVDIIIERQAFDGEELTDLFAPLNLCWKSRVKAEKLFMFDFIPYLKNHFDLCNRVISGFAGWK